MITIITIFDTGNGIAVISRLSNQAIGSLVIILHYYHGLILTPKLHPIYVS